MKLSAAGLAAALVLPQGASSAQEAWARADLATARLPAEAFPDLPSRVRAELARRGCKIPQTFPSQCRVGALSQRDSN